MNDSEVQEKSAFADALEQVKQGSEAEAVAHELFDQLTDDEKLWLLDGDRPFWDGMRSFIVDGYNVTPYVMGAIERLGIPGVRFVDGPRGVVVGNSTAFPVSMARGATWDTDLEERVGVAIGEELREQGGNFFGGVCVNLPRHPAWGRSQETYSDQPVILGEMGAALTRGIQNHAMACVKHYALNSMENARFSVDVTVDEATLQEVYLPHFKRVLDEGAYAVMSCYNSVNGEWGGQNQHMLTDILRDQWGFKGFVVTDFIWGLRDGSKALAAGLDVEAPFHQQRGAHLREDLESGVASWADVERAGVRILATQLRSYAQRAPEPVGTVVSEEHVNLAREVAERSAVLLKNDTVEGSPLLPLDPAKTQRIAVVGDLAQRANTGDHGSSDVRAPYVVTVAEGVTRAFPSAEVIAVKNDEVGGQTTPISEADVAVVVVGYAAEDEGEFVDGSVGNREELVALYPEPAADEEAIRDEVIAALSGGMSVVGSGTAGGDRRDLHLKPADVAMIKQVRELNERVVVIVVNAGTVLIEDWDAEVPAIIFGWYSGMEGGNGLARILTGEVNPSGRLPYAIPSSAEDLPYLDIDATAITYDRSYGQRLIQQKGSEAKHPLGFGLSYTEYRLDNLAVDTDLENEEVTATLTVSNTGSRDGIHVVQLYGARLTGERAYERELLGFSTVAVTSGATEKVTVRGTLTPLGRWNDDLKKIVVEPGDITVEAASYWGDPEGLSARVELA